MKRAMFADFEAGDFDGSDLGANQLEDLRVERFDHAAHLPVAAFSNRNFKESVACGVADTLHQSGARGAVREFDAVAEAVQLILRERDGRLYEICFRDLGFGTHNVIGKVGVVGHDEQAGCVLVEAAYGKDPLAGFGQQVVDGFAAFGIFIGGEVAFGFVEEEITFFGRGERTAVERHAVALHVYPQVGGLDSFPVHGDAAGADPAAGVGAGADAGSRQDAVERFQHTTGRVVFAREHSL